MARPSAAATRPRLNRHRVLAGAVALADRIGIEALSMRRLAQELDVVPMALYKHVANKEQLLDGMVELLVAEIDPPATGVDWRTAIRLRVLSARRVLLRHPWGRSVLESRTSRTPAVLGYIDSVIGTFRTGGFSDELTHHVMHALGSRMWGFTQELFDEPAGPDTSAADGGGAAEDASPEVQQAMLQALAEHFPNIAATVLTATHDDGTVVARGCDDQAEFEFALDLMLDGFERLRSTGWSPPGGH
ncbi:hypothetical protein CELL_00015 [Cellulomonas sp. T2.31MG-18]|uniref:TetR/AcrR family transcriptional regulator C-terminal domain-containing protein n=1 Tax=Cellulomonas sp. T2.31MG-18 TaxID=3157619 RepID=UPI0035E773C4